MQSAQAAILRPPEAYPMNKKNLALLALALAMTSPTFAKDRAVKGDVAKDGTHVAPHVATTPNATTPIATKADNRSSKGTVNAQTGKESAKDPYAVPLLKDARPL
jgi:hypothetical protein